MSKFFINRPIVAIVIAILMVIAGVVTMISSAHSAISQYCRSAGSGKRVYPGADAETISQSVATPIAQQMSGVDGMNYMYSQSASTG